MKSLGYSINLIKDSNRVISCSEIDFQKIRPGSYIKIGNITYQIIDRKPLFYIKDFEVVAPNAIKLKDNAGNFLLKEDVLDISYKEYELGSLLSIVDGGCKYKKGDIIYLLGGVPTIDNSNTQQITSFEVNSVDENGKLLSVGLISRGKYVSVPNNVSEVYGSNGHGAKLECFYTIIDSRRMIERSIINILRSGSDATVFLNYTLPSGLKEGKLSVNKYELILNNNYTGASLYDSKYEISQDFTINYQMPLLMKGSTSPESVFNLTMQILDTKLREIDDWKSFVTNKLSSIDAQLKSIEKKIK